MALVVPVSMAELRLAWKRTKADRPDRAFVTHPHLFDWIELNVTGWLRSLKAQLNHRFSPQNSHPCLVPKPRSMLRPATVLALSDEVVFNLLVGRMLPKIWEGLQDLQGDPDVSYQIQDPSRKGDWIKTGFLIWNEWRDKSMAKLKEGARYVAVADITGFYENIDMTRMMSELRRLGVSQDETGTLENCLRRWSQPREKGIPQGCSASHILAKVYVSNLDRALRNAGYQHLRYVDDIRIFCRTKLEAKQAVCRLTELLYQNGLNIQTAKTDILSKSKAVSRIDGVRQMIDDVQEDLTAELAPELTDGPYVSPLAITRILGDHSDLACEVLDRVFYERFSAASGDGFNKSLFHYLLVRLAKVGSRVAVDYCLDAVHVRPEETHSIMRYLAAVKLDDTEMDRLIRYMESENAIYDYQLFQLVRWFYEGNIKQPRVIVICRKWAFDRNRAPWLRSYCMAYLGNFGNIADLELIERDYANPASDVEKAQHVAALHRQEKGRRNAFYRRIQDDGDLVQRAIRVVKGVASKRPRADGAKRALDASPRTEPGPQ